MIIHAVIYHMSGHVTSLLNHQILYLCTHYKYLTCPQIGNFIEPVLVEIRAMQHIFIAARSNR